MLNFDRIFHNVAKNESRALQVFDRPEVPTGTYVLREFYCNEPDCDCRRVILHVQSVEAKRVVASINYAFEPAKPPYQDEPQYSLDPLNPQSELSPIFFKMVKELLARDADYRSRLHRHYQMWKEVVDDPSHPDHQKVRSKHHDDPSFRSAFPRRQTVRRDGPKIGPNDPCPCGSGKKWKKCCRE
jgi:hypothetical protein